MVTMVFEKFWLQHSIVSTYDLFLEKKGYFASWEIPTEMTLAVNIKINTGVWGGVCMGVCVWGGCIYI